MPKPKLTMKQARFVKGIAGGKTKTDSYVEAYDVDPNTPRKSLHEMASQTSSLPQVKNALEQLFNLEDTKQVVQNLHKLAISAEDEKNQIEATKVWMERAIPKADKDAGNSYHFTQINNDIKGKYDD
jgi:hypothetical protein